MMVISEAMYDAIGDEPIVWTYGEVRTDKTNLVGFIVYIHDTKHASDA